MKIKNTVIIILMSIISFDCYAQWSSDPSVNNAICTTDENQVGAQMTSDGSGGAIITWQNRFGGSDGANIYAQRIDAAGIVQWTTNGVAVCTAVNDQHTPQIISDGNGGAIITWYDARISGNIFPQIYAQRINSSGVRQWANNGVVITSNGVETGSMSIVSNGSGGAIIAYVVHQSSTVMDTSENNIFAQHINSSGVKLWANYGIPVCTAPENQPGTTAIADGSGGAFITWSDYRNGTNYDAYVQRINALGIKQWTSNGILINTVSNDVYSPRIVSDGNDGTIISWNEYRNGSGSGDIYAQYLDGNGLIQWTPNGVAIATAANDQNDNQIISDGSGNAIIAWTDNRTNSNYDVYAQRINISGTLSTQGQTALNKAAVSVYPNPSKGLVIIETTETITSISIFNELGKIVHNEACGDCNIKELDLSKLSNGLYFYKIISGENIITNGKLIITE